MLGKMPTVGTKLIITSAFLKWWSSIPLNSKGNQESSALKLGDVAQIVKISEQRMSAEIYSDESRVYLSGVPFEVIEEMRVKR